MTSRRNFIRNILIAGASFSILPPPEFGSRIWRVERPLIVPETEVKSIWDSHFISGWTEGLKGPCMDLLPNGSIIKHQGVFWYKWEAGSLPLRQMRRTLSGKRNPAWTMPVRLDAYVTG